MSYIDYTCKNSTTNGQSIQKLHSQNYVVGSIINEHPRQYTTFSVNPLKQDECNYEYKLQDNVSEYIGNVNIPITDVWYTGKEEKETNQNSTKFKSEMSEIYKKYWGRIREREREVITSTVELDFKKGVYTPKFKSKTTGVIEEIKQGTVLSIVGIYKMLNPKYEYYNFESTSNIKVLTVLFTNMGDYSNKWDGLVQGITTENSETGGMIRVRMNMELKYSPMAQINEWMARHTYNMCTYVSESLESLQDSEYDNIIVNLNVYRIIWRTSFDIMESRVDLFYNTSKLSKQINYMTQLSTYGVTNNLLELPMNNGMYFGFYLSNNANLDSIRKSVQQLQYCRLRIYIPQLHIEDTTLLEKTVTTLYLQKTILDLTAQGNSNSITVNNECEQLDVCQSMINCNECKSDKMVEVENVFKVNRSFYYYIRDSNNVFYLVGYKETF